MLATMIQKVLTVICRTGSLEICRRLPGQSPFVICRTGSLEIDGMQFVDEGSVICRTGSLEKKGGQP